MVELSDNSKKIIDLIKELNIVELNNLVKAMEEEFGISAAAPVMVTTGSTWWSDEVEEKTTFNVELKSAWWSKIAVIKVIRELTGLWLKEAKDLADSWWIIKKDVSKDDANTIKTKLEEQWATVEIK